MKNAQKYTQESINYTFFDNPEEVWFWFYNSLYLRYNSTTFNDDKKIFRPCEVADIMQLVARLNFSGVLKKEHIRVLNKYGKLNYIPDIRIDEEKEDMEYWFQAMDILEIELRKKGIIK